MHSTIVRYGCFFLLLGTSLFGYAQKNVFVEGEDYITLKQTLTTSTKDQIEVAGVFSYSCPHCANLEPILGQWSKTQAKDVKFTHVPAIFNQRWEFYAKVYYTIGVLGIEDEAHQAIFDTIHKDKKSLKNNQQLAMFLAEHFQQDPKKVLNIIDSFAVSSKIKMAKSFTKKAKVTFVPLVIIDGKYLTSVTHAKSEKKFIDVINYLIAGIRDKNL